MIKFVTILMLVVLVFVAAEETKPKKKKDIRDYNDADLERLFDEWEVRWILYHLEKKIKRVFIQEKDEPLEEDELPEWKKQPPKIDLTNMDPNNPEAMLQMAKKGRTLMMFASVSGKKKKTIISQRYFTKNII